MKYRVVVAQNYVTIHVNSELLPDNFNGKTPPKLGVKIRKLRGVESVEVYQYRIFVEKGELFEWNGIINKIIEIIGESLEMKMEESKE